MPRASTILFALAATLGVAAVFFAVQHQSEQRSLVVEDTARDLGQGPRV